MIQTLGVLTPFPIAHVVNPVLCAFMVSAAGTAQPSRSNAWNRSMPNAPFIACTPVQTVASAMALRC